VFVDASKDAYSCCVYLRVQYAENDVEVNLVVAKARVTPLKEKSIPRLELLGLVIGKRIGLVAAEAMEIPKEEITFWTDSTNVLWWLKKPGKTLKPFVSHRVGEIQETLNPGQVRYVPTKENPADLNSRGMSVEKLMNSSLWFHGPEYLRKERQHWPKDKVNPEPSNEDAVQEEIKETKKRTFVLNTVHHIINPEKFSSLKKLLRRTAYVLRCVKKWKKIEIDMNNEITTEEMEEALKFHIKETQREHFQKEIEALSCRKQITKDSKIQKLMPQMDSEQILRVHSRLIKAEHMSWSARHPIILPSKGNMTRLIVQNAHDTLHHGGGVAAVLAELSAKYWIVHGRQAVKNYTKNCMVCKKRTTKPVPQQMAPLPDFRTAPPLRAFARVAVDLTGAYMTKAGRGKPRHKRYACIFTCLLSRASHLEMVDSLDADEFLNAMSRFISRRGIPEMMYSDNATNFLRSEKEIKEFKENLSPQILEKYAAEKKIKRWIHGPPLGSHFNGVVEIKVKAAKKALQAILHDAEVTDRELETALCGAEALMNSMPLTYQTAEGADDLPLTPNHFLHGQAGGQLAPEMDELEQKIPTKRWKYVQQLIGHFWKRWTKEFVPLLHPRQKWLQEGVNYKVNDVVLIMEPNQKRGQWKMGRVQETLPGKDGLVRVVKIKVIEKNDQGRKVAKFLVRPVSKICPLVIQEKTTTNEPAVDE
jgi:ribosomal protein S28E/S33